jgi:branched-subunit amino acid ABC-type transport system permease component
VEVVQPPFKWLGIGFEIKNANGYRDIVAMALILGVLAIRPRGIFGRAAVQRV